MAAIAITAIFVFGAATAASAQHYVKSGDTLSQIAKQYKMSMKDIISLNPHIEDPNKIKPNDYIVIRSKAEPQKDLVDYARSLQSVTAYKYGGNDFPNYVDCSAWAKGIYQKFGVSLPRISRDQALTGQPVTFKQLQIGDLMFFQLDLIKESRTQAYTWAMIIGSAI